MTKQYMYSIMEYTSADTSIELFLATGDWIFDSMSWHRVPLKKNVFAASESWFGNKHSSQVRQCLASKSLNMQGINGIFLVPVIVSV